jgi:hypothetical protein
MDIQDTAKPTKIHLTPKEQIIENERRLLEAIKNNDHALLDDLLHDDLLFTIPTGQTITKAMDLETYRSGKVSINSISSSEQTINLIDPTAIVAVTIEIRGKYLDHSLDGKFRYLRVWKFSDDQWKVIAGSCVSL